MGPLDLDEDVAKINAVIVGAFGCVALARKFPGWEITPEQGLMISGPLYEMGKKYPKLTETILEASAPVSLAVALTMIVGSRVMADKVYHDMMRQHARAAQHQSPPSVEPQHVGARPVPNGNMPPPPDPDRANPSGFPKDLRGLQEMYANGEAVEV